MSTNNKELEDLLIEFDEMGFEPTTLCENPQREVETFRNRLKQALTELKAIKEAKPSEAMEILLKAKQERLNFYGILLDNDEIFFEKLEQALLKAQEFEKENAELNQHIKRWHDLLLKTGINSKGTVVDEIENYWTIKMKK